MSVPRFKLLPLVRHKKVDPFCILETSNTISREELKGAVLLPVCKKVCSWTVVLALPLRVSLILRQSQSFSSVICTVGVPPHLVTHLQSCVRCSSMDWCRDAWQLPQLNLMFTKCFRIPGKHEGLLFTHSRLCHKFPGQLPHRPESTQHSDISNILSGVKLCLLSGNTGAASSRARLHECWQVAFCLLLSEDDHQLSGSNPLLN